MKRITLKELNMKYRQYLKYSITGNKDRFGWYSATLKNGAVVIATTYAELEISILNNLERR